MGHPIAFAMSCWLETGHRSCPCFGGEDYPRPWLPRGRAPWSHPRVCPSHVISRIQSFSPYFYEYHLSLVIYCLDYWSSLLVWSWHFCFLLFLILLSKFSFNILKIQLLNFTVFLWWFLIAYIKYNDVHSKLSLGGPTFSC